MGVQNMDAMKRCSKCGGEKPLDEFCRDATRADGHATQCKACKNAYQTKYRETPEGKAARARYRNSDKGKATIRAAIDRYRVSDKGKANAARGDQAHKQRNPERVGARKAVYHAVRDGKLPAPSTQTCVGCGDPAEHYHHPDYDYHLAVMALCRPCHKELHACGTNY